MIHLTKAQRLKPGQRAGPKLVQLEVGMRFVISESQVTWMRARALAA